MSKNQTKSIIPEWKYCYYHDDVADQLISLCSRAYAIHCNIEDLTHVDHYDQHESSRLISQKDEVDEIKVRCLERVRAVVDEANAQYFAFNSLNQTVFFYFLAFKVHDLEAKLYFYNACKPHTSHRTQLNKLLLNINSQIQNLSQMSRMHKQTLINLNKKHQKQYNLFKLSSPTISIAPLNRIVNNLYSIQSRLHNQIRHCGELVVQDRKVYEEYQTSPFIHSVFTYLFGLFNSFSACILITTIIVLRINFGREIDSSPKFLTFSNQYRLWKFTGQLLIFNLGHTISYYLYTKYEINYQRIFQDDPSKQAVRRLGTSTFFVLFWCSLFWFYALDLLNLHNVVRVVDNQYPITVFFPAALFILFAVFGILQFGLGKGGVGYYLVLWARVLGRLLVCGGVGFTAVWAIQQSLSFVQLVYDFAFSICYYSLNLPTPTTPSPPCNSLKILPQILSLLFLTLSIWLQTRICIKNKKIEHTSQLYKIIRSTLLILTCIISLASQSFNPGVPIVWVVFIVFVTLYCFFVDVWVDWGVLKGLGKKRYEGIFQAWAVGGMVVFNLVARMAFIVTICPTLIYNYTSNPQVIISVASMIEIVRRVIWNLLRMESEQLKNMHELCIMGDNDRIMKKIAMEVSAIETVQYRDSLADERSEMQLQILRKLIYNKLEMTKSAIKLCEKNGKILTETEIEAKTKIQSLVMNEAPATNTTNQDRNQRNQ